MTTTQCIQIIEAEHGGTRRCSRQGTHVIPSGTKMVCSQHARSYDTPVGGAR